MGRATADPSESGAFRLANSASHLLHRAEQLAVERFTELVGEAVTLRQFALLAAIAEAKGASQTDLVRATGIDRSTIADMLKRMETRGWITRTPSAEDGRVVAVHLAGTGSSLLHGYDAHARAADAAILDDLPRTKRRALLNLLTDLIEIADEKAAKAERDARKQAKREAKERAKVRAKEKAKIEKEKAKQEKAKEKKAKGEAPRKPRAS